MESISISVDCILLDIEGTTTSISFVKDVLFKYVRDNLDTFIKSNWNEPKMKECLQVLIKQSEVDVSQDLEGVVPIPSFPNDTASTSEVETFQNAVISNVLWQMSLDRKTTSLKELQAYMWISSYNSGVIHGHIFDDVPEAFEKWKSLGKRIYIYSSGSIAAQKLLFQHTTAGDLTKLLSGYFDTTTGPKMESQSYEKIAQNIGMVPSKILFLTDIPKEALAALTAGMKTFLVVREGNAPIPKEENCCKKIYSFSQIDII